MTKSFLILALVLTSAIFSLSAAAAPEPETWEVQALSQIIPGTPQGYVDFDPSSGLMTGTNGVFVRYGSTVLTADGVSVNRKTGEALADGNVRIESGDQLWVGEHIGYNFKTRQMTSEQFRTGKSPLFAGGNGLTGDLSNRLDTAHNGASVTNKLGAYTAQDSFVTTDDIFDPAYRIRASRITILPGKSVEMWNAVLLLGKVPVFYFPYYKRNLGSRANNFNFSPGYRSRYGAYILGTYSWFLGEEADGKIHVDYRERRGIGAGPDVNLHLGRWGDASLKYYYLDDSRPNSSTNIFPMFGNIQENRQRFYLGWQATPLTNLNVKALVNYQSDPLVLHDFFEGDYSLNPQPNTFVEVNKYWDNWSLDALTTPRVNSFFNQIERLPDVKLTGLRQRVFNTPVFYDSESSIGWYRSYVANMTNGFYPLTNGFYADSATRADTYHQFTVPWTLFNWLNVSPRVGGRFTYYSGHVDRSIFVTSPNGGSIYFPNSYSETYRAVFNTGIGTSFKASALWSDAKNSFFEVDGLRHIIEPSVNYVFVPDPSTPPAQLPQFDSEMPALLISPITFPDYNSIDSIDTMNVIRFGVRNVLQTKRDGQLDDLVNWNLMLDWRLDPRAGQSDLNDLYSQLAIRPRSWLTLESQMRYDLDRGNLNLSFHQLTFAPNDRWSWGLSHWYLRDGFITSQGNSFFGSTIFVRLSDNWGARATHNFNAQTGRLQEQFYTVYRDMRSWTGTLTFRVTDDVNGTPDFTIAFALSLKASPSMHVGEDVVNRYRLIGE